MANGKAKVAAMVTILVVVLGAFGTTIWQLRASDKETINLKIESVEKTEAETSAAIVHMQKDIADIKMSLLKRSLREKNFLQFMMAQRVHDNKMDSIQLEDIGLERGLWPTPPLITMDSFE